MTKAAKPSGAAGAEPKVEIDSEVTRNIRQHARAHSKTEVCGVLIGEFENGTIDISASIEGINAAQAGTHVTFTQDAWEAIYRVKDDLYPNQRIVGWYHSHPGFGVFLSDHDLFIQQNFFSSPGQVAWVYDPHTDEEGCFGWVGGEIHRIAQLAVMDRNGDGVERTPKRSGSEQASLEDEEEDVTARSVARGRAPAPAWMRWTGVFLTHLSAALVGFALAYFLFPRIFAVAVDPLTGNRLLCELPYADRCSPLPADIEVPDELQQATPGRIPTPSSSTLPPAPGPAPSTAPTPAQPAAPGSHK